MLKEISADDDYFTDGPVSQLGQYSIYDLTILLMLKCSFQSLLQIICGERELCNAEWHAPANLPSWHCMSCNVMIAHPKIEMLMLSQYIWQPYQPKLCVEITPTSQL